MSWAARAPQWRSQRVFPALEGWVIAESPLLSGDRGLKCSLAQGIPSRRLSLIGDDCVPALCTHRPSLLPIEWSSEVFGLSCAGMASRLAGNRMEICPNLSA